MSQLKSQSRTWSVVSVSIQRLGKRLSLKKGSWYQQAFPTSKIVSYKIPQDKIKGKPQKSGSVFVCWLVCWWDWVYWTNWLDWCVVGRLGPVWFDCWFSDWYCSSSLFLLMADCSCCLIASIWPSRSDSSWTNGFRIPWLKPQSLIPNPWHWVTPCPDPPWPCPIPCPSPHPNRSERPLEVVTMGMCLSSVGRVWGWESGEGGGGGGRSWDDGQSRSFCRSCGRNLRLLQWDDSAGFQGADWLFPSLHLR